MGYKNPTTKYQDVVDYYKRIKSLENLTFARIEAGVLDREKAFESLKQGGKKINEDYAKLLNPSDCYFFKKIGELELFLRECDLFSKADIKDILDHEDKHYNEAIRQGYKQTGFRCWLALDKGNIEYIVTTCIRAYSMPTHDKYKKISRAPTKLSVIDEMS